MITKENYYQILAGADRKKFDSALTNAAELVDLATEKGTDWSAYEGDATIRRTIDDYFRQLSEFLNLDKKPARKALPKTGKPDSIIVDEYGKKHESEPRERKAAEPTAPTEKAPSRTKKKPLRIVKRASEYVERISDEVRFIDRFASMNGRLKTKNAIRLFIKALQDAITEKRLRASSPYANELNFIQDSLLSLYGKFRGDDPIMVTIASERLNKLLEIAGKQEQLLSVRFIKSYINLQGKRITNKQASMLHNKISKAIENGSLSEKDRYWDEVTSIHMSLKSFVKKNAGEGILVIPERELNGLNGIAGIGSVSGLNGIATVPQNTMMNSMDFVQMTFDKIGFTGKWLAFMGNPSRGFTALVSGPPKSGKSIMCTGWAGDLAREHGPVLYVAKEEGLDDTLKEKLADVAHPNLTVADYLPGDLRQFDFVFLDSITRLQLTPEDVNTLKAANPDVSFILISQVTKSGKARGSNEFAHDVDSIIEFPEKGKAVQYGRFNQGGTMRIFTDHQNQ